MLSKGEYMNQKNIDKFVYKEAKNFLPDLGIAGVDRLLIDKYLNPTSLPSRPDSIPKIYERILESAQNANMKAGVIGGSIGGIGNLSHVLFSFDPKKVLRKYGHNYENLLDDIETKLRPKGKIRKTNRSLWPQYCRTILSGAEFISQFVSANDFFKWVNFFDEDNRARPSLPTLLSSEILGFGFALACDFLKEMGHVNFPKPDVHLRDIFQGLGLCVEKADDYTLFKSIIRVSLNAKVTPYNADKVFWLIVYVVLLNGTKRLFS
jgi:thermostable 8-oxoguanine DNA glycosylase